MKMPHDSALTKIIIILVGIILIVELFSLRGILKERYDTKYMSDLYAHSQWSIGKSIRSISDAGLYEVAGHQIVTTNTFFDINPEVPPLGKYIIGTSILIFHNGKLLSSLLYILSVGFFYLLIAEIFKKPIQKAFALLLYVSEPLIFSQAGLSMLDLPQLCALLLHMFAMIRIRNQKKTNLFQIILAGITFGAFISIKIGFLSAIIFLVDVYILFQIKKLKWILPIIVIGNFMYVSTYIGYFLGGHTFQEFMASQKWMVHFYLSSNVKPVYGTVFTSLIGGFIKGWSEGNTSWIHIAEWSIFWPFYLVSFVMTLIKVVKSNSFHSKEGYLSILVAGLLGAYIFIPFFSRYLLLILPFLIIFLVHSIERFKIPKITIIGLYSLLLVQLTLYLYPTPSDTAQQIQRKWQASIYQDLYSHFDTDSQQNLDRDTFWKRMLVLEKQLKSNDKSVEVRVPYTFPWEQQKLGTYIISYRTPLGSLTQKGTIKFVRQDNVWKIHWNPSLALSNWDYNDHIISEIHEGEYGVMKTKNGEEISKSGMRPYFTVVPSKIQDDMNLQNQLFQLTGIDKKIIEQKYKANTPSEWPVIIGFLHPTWPETYLETFHLDPGIVIATKQTRTYNNNIVTKVNYPSYYNLELKYGNMLYPKSGGQIILITTKGKRILLLSRSKENGKDVILP